MLDRNRSGQFLYFGLVSALSGNGVTGASGAIASQVAIDATAARNLSGFVIELQSGQYRANLFAQDTDGNCLGFLFLASGCVPVSYTVITQNNVSGKLVPQSGLTYPASGAFATVPIASISGTNAVVPPANLSGVFATVPAATLSGVVVNSGLFTTVPTASISGVNAVVSPAILSGIFATVPIAAVSGISAVVPPANLSGVFTSVPTASISGTVVLLVSGTTYFASGQSVSLNSGQLVIAASGVSVVVPPSTLSGVTVNSGLFTTVPIATVSGINAVVPPASLSGTTVNLISGTTYLASGASVTVASGVFATVPISSVSGLNAVVPPETVSGVFATVPPATISGVNVIASINSGSLYLASGSLFANTFASGVIAVELPYGFLKTNMSGVTGEADRSPLNALRFLRNRWYVSGTDLHVTKEDDTTDAWTSVLTTNASGQPIAGSDPT